MRYHNINYRNANALISHPFTDNCSMYIQAIAIPLDWLLDCNIYLNGIYTEPLRLGALYKNADDNLQIVFVSGSAEVAYGELTSKTDTAFLYDRNDVLCGTVLHTPSITAELLTRLPRIRLNTSIDDFMLAAECVHIVTSNGCRGVYSANHLYEGDISITAGKGMRFESYRDGYCLSLYGDYSPKARALRSINGVVPDGGTFWLSSHIDSALRVITISGALVVGKTGSYT